MNYTLETLRQKTITELKIIAKQYDITGLSKYSKANKDDLAQIIYTKSVNLTKYVPRNIPRNIPINIHPQEAILMNRARNPFDDKPESNVKNDSVPEVRYVNSPPKPQEPILTYKARSPFDDKPESNIKNDSVPEVRYVNSPPKPQVVQQPSFFSEQKYTFNPSDAVPINDLKIVNYETDNITAISDNTFNVTPEILTELLKDSKFIFGVKKSLYDLYDTKLIRYKKIKDTTEISIKEDLNEQRLLGNTFDQDELKQMFPMIKVNKLLLSKIDSFIELINVNRSKITNTTISKNLYNAINDPDNGILSISGDSREFIRNELCRTVYILSKGYQPFMDSFINMVFTGPAGVGKTRLATSVAYIYKQMGILLKGELLIVSPKDLIGQYIGQTSSKTAGVLMKGLEGIIFIDEAYQIMPCENGAITKDGKSYGPEAITEIVNFLDKYIGLSVMIVAGYEREMQGCFFAANEGLQRRFPYKYELPPYSIDSLMNIFINNVNSRLGKKLFSKETALYIYSLMIFLDKHNKDIFKNQAGDMLNLSTLFFNNYYGVYGINWENSMKDKRIIINKTFDQFLRNKGFAIL